MKSLIRKYQMGDIIPRIVAVPFLYDVENPFRKNVTGDYATYFDDGWAKTIGAGISETSEAPKKWFTGKKIPIEKVDDYAYNHLMNDDKVIRKAYDKKFGTSSFPTPSDTLSIGPRLYAAQNRYQRGRLAGGKQEGIDEILNAMAKGDKNVLINAVSKWTPSTDKNRMSRVLQAYPEVYNNWDSPRAKILSKVLNFKQRLKSKMGIFSKEQPRGKQLKKGGKAFIPEVNVLDSDPKAYKYVKKKYKMRSAQQGTKLSGFGNFLNNNSELITNAIGSIVGGIQKDKYRKELEQWKAAQLAAQLAAPEDFTKQVLEEEEKLKQENPDYNSSPIVTAFKANQLANQALINARNKLSPQLDNQIAQQLNNFKSSNSGFGDILTTGLGLVGNYLSNGNNKKQTAAV